MSFKLVLAPSPPWEDFRDDDIVVLVYTGGSAGQAASTPGGEVFPKEVEEVINHYPAVELAGVTSVLHQHWGEAVTSVIQLKEDASADEAEITAWCKERLADFKAPKYILFVDELPRLITGKVHYREIKKLVSDKYDSGGFQCG